MKLCLLFCFSLASLSAATCTVWNQAAVTNSYSQPLYPSITGGVVGISGGVTPDAYTVELVWTSDATGGTPATQQRVYYATAAEWASNPDVYPHFGQSNGFVVSDGTTPQMITFGALHPGTSYHAQPQSLEGATWCTNLDITFTTAAAPGVVYPAAPAAVTNLAMPTPLRTRTVQTSSGCTGVDDATAFQNCLNSYSPGDQIIIPRSVHPTTGASFTAPDNPAAQTFTIATGSPAVFTCAGCSAWLANGVHVVMGGVFGLPAGSGSTDKGLSAAYVYKVIDVGTGGANTFHLSSDGTNAIAVTSAGVGTLKIARYPEDTINVPITTVISDGNLPPEGVDLDTTAYGPQLAVIEKDGTPGAWLHACGTGISPDACPLMSFGVLASNWHLAGLKFTTNDITAAGETIPNSFGYMLLAGSGCASPFSIADVCPSSYADVSIQNYNYGIIIDRDWVTSAPAPNSIEFGIAAGGKNSAVINSVIDASWNNIIGRFLPASTAGGNVFTVNGGAGFAGVFAYPLNHQCAVTSAKALTLSGTGTFYVYLDPTNSCALTALLQTGVTATGAGYTIPAAVASPAYPVSANGRYTVLPIASGSIAGGVVTFTDTWEQEVPAVAIYFTGNPGPFLSENNRVFWSDIGIFADTGSRATCGGGCLPLSGGVADITLRRNFIQWSPKYYNLGAQWAGWGSLNHTGAIETKTCLRCLITGNIINPVPVNYSKGMCIEHVNLESWGDGADKQFVNFSWVRDIEDKHNTCWNDGNTFSTGGNYGVLPFDPIAKNWWAHDNVSIANWFYSYWQPQAAGQYGADGGQGTFMLGGIFNQNILVEHNTDYFRAGHGTFANFSVGTGNTILRNNFATYLGNPYHVYNSDQNGQPCSGAAEYANVSCFNNVDWQITNNYALPTYGTNGGDPTNLIDLVPGSSAGQIGAYQALWPGTSMSMIAASTSTTAARLATVGWFNPAIPGDFYTTPSWDLRLKSTSAYISGGHLATDGENIGANMDALNAEQGQVSNVRALSLASTGATIAFLAPDSFACSVDWGTSAFWTGSGTWTRVTGAAGSTDPRVQSVALSGLPADSLVYYRVNCAVQQPTGSIKLP